MRRFCTAASLFLAGCAAAPDQSRPSAPPDAPDAIVINVPDSRSFAASSPGPSLRPNAEITRDFLDLSFQMESGRVLPVLTRFDEPITVRVAGNVSQQLVNDLTALLARLRNEARIDIRMTAAAEANITIEAVPNRTLQRVAPTAACFVVPRVRNWDELRAARNSATLDWATLQRRDTAAIFVPSDQSPQELRDCLHEELAQALGPLNDLYRLPDSVFNDDNMHAVLTGFDMLVLRAYYSPQLRNGMTRAEVADRLPGILAQINPGGQRNAGPPPSRTPRDWISDMETALTDNRSSSRRRAAALRAIRTAERLGWRDTRTGFSNYAYGRLQLGNDAALALGAFDAAARIYSQSPVTAIQSAHVAVQFAAFALIAGDAAATIAITQAAIPIARRHENAALMSLLMMFQAEALDLQGQTAAATALRLDSLGWARYGFGSREEVIDRLNEIASLPPRNPPS